MPFWKDINEDYLDEYRFKSFWKSIGDRGIGPRQRKWIEDYVMNEMRPPGWASDQINKDIMAKDLYMDYATELQRRLKDGTVHDETQITSDTIEAILKRAYSRAVELDDVSTQLKVAKQLSELYGVDRPQKHEHSGIEINITYDGDQAEQ